MGIGEPGINRKRVRQHPSWPPQQDTSCREQRVIGPIQKKRGDVFEESGGFMRSTFRAGLFVFVLGLLPAGPVAFAQGVGASADLTGTVTDPSGAEVPNAK